MEFKNVPEPIPCYFLLENSAKSKPTPVTVPFSEDLVPGYDLFTRPTLFSSFPHSSPPPSPSTKYSSHLTVPTPSLSQDDAEAPPVPSPKCPLSCSSASSSASSSSTLQSRGDDPHTSTIPDIAIPDISVGGDLGQSLVVPVPNISVTAAANSPSPIDIGTAHSGDHDRTVIDMFNPLKAAHKSSHGEGGQEAMVPESLLVSVPKLSLQERRSATQQKRRERLSLPSSSNLSPLSSLGSCPFSSVTESGHWSEGVSLGRLRRECELDSVSSMSPLREEATEDSLYSSFEGSEVSDQEHEERRQRREERERRRSSEGGRVRERQGLERWREMRRKGETIQPRLLTVGGGLKVTVGAGDLAGDMVGQSDGTEDMNETTPIRKISDCSSRSVDSGTKMSEISKDDEDCQRKLSDLSEASQNDSAVEEEERGERERSEGARSDISEPTFPVRPLRRRGLVHNKVDFFNKWIQHHCDTSTMPQTLQKKRSRLCRTQSERVFSNLSSVRQAPPRRGSLLTRQHCIHQTDSTET